MRWRNKFLDSFEWHDWYAWRPVWIEREVVWLEVVQRKRMNLRYPSSFLTWEYRGKVQ